MTAAPDKLHVGFALPSLAGGGAERVALDLADALIQRGHRIDLLLARFRGAYREGIPAGTRLYYPRLPNSDKGLLGYCRERGIETKALTIDPLAATWAWLLLRRKHRGMRVGLKQAVFAWVIARYIREARPHLLMSAPDYSNIPAIYAAELARRAVPVVVSEHSNARFGYTGYWLREARALYPRAEAVVAVSEGVRGDMRRLLGVKAGQVRTIYNPIPSAEIWRQAQDEVSHPWFGDGEPPVILSVGREAPPKDYPTLVDALGIVRRSLPARLLILGSLSEAYRSALIDQARAIGVENDLGFVNFDENPFRYMRRAGLLALSSLWEGLGMTLLEAMACGTPVVSADTPHGPREILEDGRWGKLAPVGDAPALAQAMVETLRGDRPTEEALRSRAAEFSERRAADAYERLFREVAHVSG